MFQNRSSSPYFETCIKYGITQNLTLDFTVNTDFAQVEVDQQQVNLNCERTSFLDVKKVEGGGGLGQGRRDPHHHPDSGGNLGEFIAMDSATGPSYDVSSGTLLWQSRVTTSPQGFPVSYAVGGRQYLAVPVGGGAAGWSNLLPMTLTPEIKRPNTGNALFVFALPEAAGRARRE